MKTPLFWLSLLLVVAVAAGCTAAQPAAVPAAVPTVAPTVAPTAAPTAPAAPAGATALTVTGAVDKDLALTMDDLKAMEVVQVTAEHPKKGQQTNEGVRLNGVLKQAGVKPAATTVVITVSDGSTAEVSLADLAKCADCLVAFTNEGLLKTVMPGMESNLWVKDVIKLDVK